MNLNVWLFTNRPYLERAMFQMCMISIAILVLFERKWQVWKNPEIWTKYFSGFRRYGCFNSDISKYGHMNENYLYFLSNLK